MKRTLCLLGLTLSLLGCSRQFHCNKSGRYCEAVPPEPEMREFFFTQPKAWCREGWSDAFKEYRILCWPTQQECSHPTLQCFEATPEQIPVVDN